MNKIILYGFTGKDPEIRNLESGKKVAKFSLATNKVYTNSQGEKITETSWHNVILWNKLADLAEKYIKKGSSVIIEGEISYRSYDNKDGQTIYITEIIGDRLHFAGGPKEEKPKSNKVHMDSLTDPAELGNAENDPSYDPFA